MFDLKAYTHYIEQELNGLDIPTSPAGLYEPIRYFLGIGGKRLRPILTLLSAEMFGADKKHATPQALSIEVLHNFTLIHDDIMDEAPLRRNKATVHTKWNTNVGILSGDVMLVQAYQLLADIAPDKLPSALTLFNKTAIEVCEGQQHDMDFEERTEVSLEDYIEMIRLKTSVLLGCALKLGALVADASEKDQDAIYNFGLHVGIAFQIQDDILDLYADPEKFGKQVGGDVIANKKTMLHITAFGKGTAEQREIMRQLANESNLELKVNRTRELFDSLSVKEECKARMGSHLDEALASLKAIHVSDEKKQNLYDLANYLMHRDI